MAERQQNLFDRCAGVLMHITSLPGAPFIGDLGPGAAAFVDFLHASGQSVWQLLPVQPTVQEQGFSPYSSSSAFAGNPLLISPEILLRDGYLDKKDLKTGLSSTLVDFNKAVQYKERLLRKAWANWQRQASASEKTTFLEFCSSEHEWLDDYALYNLFKYLNKGKAWFQWHNDLKNRDEASLKKAESEHAAELNFTKWVQMIFDRQWRALHKLCDSAQVKLLGDVPIYVAYDSADVWSHRDLFTINEDGNLMEVAGVPPDLFNDEGQLWGMPLFRWERLKETGYGWWVARLRKNIRWFDVVRLDHFRGFSSYWSVPASATSAKSGKWVTGPGDDFFNVIEKEFGNLPFVAEDLGEIDQPVYHLRDNFNLPGMNVLQFAFGKDMPKSNYLPHNHSSNSIVYTGTHDNNTTVGWYKDADKIERRNLAAYSGVNVSSANVAHVLMRLAYLSVSRVAIVPMQDVLSLGGNSRMNMPASLKGNWTWRLKKELLTPGVSKKLRAMTETYDRSLKVV